MPFKILKSILFSKVKIKAVHFDHRATFVPKSLYNPAQKKNYLNYNVSLEEGGALLKKKLKTIRSKSSIPLRSKQKPPYNIILKTSALPTTPKYFTTSVPRKQ